MAERIVIVAKKENSKHLKQMEQFLKKLDKDVNDDEEMESSIGKINCSLIMKVPNLNRNV